MKEVKTMDMKVYRKTRYQNIYKHKNGNYVISISKPVKTSISKVDGKKIISIEEALKIRDNHLTKASKLVLKGFSGYLDELWDKYIFDCKFVKKLAYNSILRKEKAYNKYLKGKVDKKVSKTTKDFWIKYIDNLDTTLKQKNEVIKQLKCLFNWAIENEWLIINPIDKVKKYRVINKEMQIWDEKEFMSFIVAINNDINSSNLIRRKIAYVIKIIAYVGFCNGLRIGEIRALTFGAFNKEKSTLTINYSINYEKEKNSYLAPTKTEKSKREVIINQQLNSLIDEYKKLLILDFNIDIKEDSLIIFNYNNNSPYTDSTLRKHFNYYINKAEVKRINMKDLRHCYATNMLLHDVSIKYVSEDMGHSSVKITGDVYSHTLDQKRKENAKITDNLFI